VNAEMMSTSGIDFWIVVDARHVPDDLVSAVLPVEIVPPRGLVETNQVRLSDGEVLRENVDGPGRYVVRIELPSGKWIAAFASVPEKPDAWGRCVGTGTLDFSELQTPARRLSSWNVVRSEAAALAPFDELAAAAALGRATLLAPVPDTQSDFSHAVRDRRSDWQILVRQVAGSAVQEPGFDTRQWKPTFHAFDSEASGGPESSRGTLVVAPPIWGQRLAITPDSQPRGDGPPYLVSGRVTDPSAHVLFSYLRTALPDRARNIAPSWVMQAEVYLRHKIDDPVAATQGAYVLLGLGDDRRREWVENLAEWFEFLPDGAVIAGWHDLRRGEPERAAAWFSVALSRGIPMFSEGVRLLQQGCTYLRGLVRDDGEIARLSAISYRLASFTNLNSELTCIRLSDSDFFLEELAAGGSASRESVQANRWAARARRSGIPPHRPRPLEWRPASQENAPHYEALVAAGVVVEENDLSEVEFAAMAEFGRQR
jgi:hypothetical protein